MLSRIRFLDQEIHFSDFMNSTSSDLVSKTWIFLMLRIKVIHWNEEFQFFTWRIQFLNISKSPMHCNEPHITSDTIFHVDFCAQKENFQSLASMTVKLLRNKLDIYGSLFVPHKRKILCRYNDIYVVITTSDGCRYNEILSRYHDFLSRYNDILSRYNDWQLMSL